jgi:hypothetical protein
MAKLWICILWALHYYTADGKTKDCELNGSKHSLNLVCSYSIHACSFHLLMLFQDI